MIEISDRVLSYGKSTFIREVAIPVSTEVEGISKEYPCNDNQKLEVHGRPTAFASGLEAILGVVVFFGAWATKKFLDEIYDATFGPIAKEKLKAYIEKSSDHSKKYALSISLNKKNKQNSILICCVGSNVQEIEASEIHIPNVMKISESYIDSSNDGSVFLFVIDNGVCNLNPSIHRNFADAINRLKKHYPIKPPQYIRTKIS